MKNQKEKIKHLLNLIKENPDLEIIAMVETDLCVSMEYSYCYGSWGEATVDEIYSDEEKTYFKSEHYQELVEQYEDNICYELFPTKIILNDEERETVNKKTSEIVKNLNWKKVIVVIIGVP